jgi:hypothetical protein
VGGGGEGVSVVAEFVLQGAEELGVGDIDESLGHLPEGGLGGGAQLGQEFLEAGFAVFNALCCGRNRSVQHGCDLAVTAMGQKGFPTTPTP